MSQVRPSSPQTQGQAQAQPQKQVSDVYSNTLPVRRPAPAKNKNPVGKTDPHPEWGCREIRNAVPGDFNASVWSGETRTLPRSSSMAAGLEKNGRSRVQAIFSHAAGDNGTLLSFSEGDVITLLVPEARDGWHYGENEKNKM